MPSAALVEDRKTSLDFDRRVLTALIPAGHPKHYVVREPPLLGELLDIIRRNVDPFICECFQNGCQAVPPSAFEGQAVRTRRSFRMTSEAEVLLRQLIVEVYASQGRSLRRDELRAAHAKLRVTFEQRILRLRLVRLLAD